MQVRCQATRGAAADHQIGGGAEAVFGREAGSHRLPDLQTVVVQGGAGALRIAHERPAVAVGDCRELTR